MPDVSGRQGIEVRMFPITRAEKAAAGQHRPYARGEIRALTSLRGIAALMVLLLHFSETAVQYCVSDIPSLAPHGYMAVDFFFVLSGFIMAYTYLDNFREIGMRAYFPFLLKRVARIAPLMWATTIAIVVLGGIASIWGRSDLFINDNAARSGIAPDIIINILQIQGYFAHFNLNPPSWSISFELGAYLLFPIFIYVLFNGRLMAVAVAIMSISALLEIAYRGPALAAISSATSLSIARSFIEFALGMATYRLFIKQGFAHFMGSDAVTWTASVLCLALFVARQDLLLELIFPVIVFTWARNVGAAQRLLSSRFPYFLGTISFSIYIVHNMMRLPELELVRHLAHSPLTVAEAVAFVIFGSLTVLPIATLSYYLVEHPGRIAFNTLFQHARRQLAPS